MAIQSDLVIDLGLHKGEDTAFYLAKGFRVVSVEADPDLARECQARFVPELSAQGLRIIEGAIAEGGPKVTFYKDEKSVWGTVNQDWAKRNEKLGSHHRLIEVNVLDIGQIFNDFGIPYYTRRNDVPGRALRAGQGYGVLVCLHILRPQLAFGVVAFADLPISRRIVEPLLETRQLFLRADVEKELQNG